MCSLLTSSFVEAFSSLHHAVAIHGHDVAVEVEEDIVSEARV